MRLAIICCAVLTIVACGETNQNQSVASQPVSAVVSEQPKTQAVKAAEILAAFKEDIAVCKSVMSLLKNDQSFEESFHPYDERFPKTLESFLREPRYEKSVEVNYVLRNLKYFDIDEAGELPSVAVAWIEGSGRYCAPTYLRLLDIEALGETEEGWKVRVFFLDAELDSLIPPYVAAPGWGIEFDDWKEVLDEASRRYSTSQRRNFILWAHKAILAIEAQRRNITRDEGGRSVAEQNKMLDEQLTFLRQLIEQDNLKPVSSKTAAE